MPKAPQQPRPVSGAPHRSSETTSSRRPSSQQEPSGAPEFFAVIRSRRSVRHYGAAEVSAEQLDAVLDAIRRAPSAGDLQAYEVVVVRAPEGRRRLAAASYDQEFVAEAPVVLVFFMDQGRSGRKYGERGAALFACQDATIAAAHAQLAAHALGLATVWIGAFDEDAVSRVVAAPPRLRPSSLLVVGHPAETPAPPPRRSLDELVRWETFGPSLDSAPEDEYSGA